jgi:hypothetical protein
VVVVGMHCGLQSKLRGFKKTKQEMCASQNTPVYINYQTTGSFPHNFCSVYWIFTKLDHMIALWKGKNPIYFGII